MKISENKYYVRNQMFEFPKEKRLKVERDLGIKLSMHKIKYLNSELKLTLPPGSLE
jgi:hypothetical protein